MNGKIRAIFPLASMGDRLGPIAGRQNFFRPLESLSAADFKGQNHCREFCKKQQGQPTMNEEPHHHRCKFCTLEQQIGKAPILGNTTYRTVPLGSLGEILGQGLKTQCPLKAGKSHAERDARVLPQLMGLTSLSKAQSGCHEAVRAQVGRAMTAMTSRL